MCKQRICNKEKRKKGQKASFYSLVHISCAKLWIQTENMICGELAKISLTLLSYLLKRNHRDLVTFLFRLFSNIVPKNFEQNGSIKYGFEQSKRLIKGSQAIPKEIRQHNVPKQSSICDCTETTCTCSWFDDVLHRCTHALAVAQQLNNVQKFWILDLRRETSTTWRLPCRDRESKVVEVMRINIRLQPSFIHRNTIYTDGGGSYKHVRKGWRLCWYAQPT